MNGFERENHQTPTTTGNPMKEKRDFKDIDYRLPETSNWRHEFTPSIPEGMDNEQRVDRGDHCDVKPDVIAIATSIEGGYTAFGCMEGEETFFVAQMLRGAFMDDRTISELMTLAEAMFHQGN